MDNNGNALNVNNNNNLLAQIRQQIGPHCTTAANAFEFVCMDGKSIFFDGQLLRKFVDLEDKIGLFLMSFSSSAEKVGQMSEESKKDICSFVSEIFHYLKGLLPGVDMSTSYDQCIANAMQGDVEKMRSTLQEIITSNRLEILNKEITLEKLSGVVSVFTLLSNVDFLFNGLSKLQMENQDQDNRFKLLLQRQVDRFGVIQRKIEQNHQINASEVFEGLNPILEDLSDLVNTIQSKHDIQVDKRNSAGGTALMSLIRLGATVTRAILFKDLMSVMDVGIMAASGATHALACGTSIWIATSHAQDVARFRLTLVDCKAMKTRVEVEMAGWQRR